MKVVLSFSGSFPRDEGVAKIHSMRKSGEIDDTSFIDKIATKELKLLNLLEALGFSQSTDGMLWSDDIINPVVSMSNVGVNGLVRFFDNNFFLRAPIVKESISFREGEYINWIIKIREKLKEKNKLELKVAFPGPATLSLFSQNSFYPSSKDLVIAWGESFLFPLIERLKKEGFSTFEIHEPAMTSRRTSREMKQAASEELSNLFENFKTSNFILLTYFDLSLRDWNTLLKVVRPNSILGIDLHVRNSRKAVEALSEIGEKRIYMGALNSRNPIRERASFIKKWIFRARDLGFNEIFVGNNAPMDFIPPKWAISKLRKLSNVVSGMRW
ncbi:MAG: hypothetical protein QW039_06600 [Fervidicoccaceae archaeon]